MAPYRMGDRGHRDQGIRSRNKLPVDRSSSPFPPPSKIIIREVKLGAMNHREFVKNDFHAHEPPVNLATSTGNLINSRGGARRRGGEGG